MRIKNNQPRLYTCAGVRLLPGINDIPDEKIPEQFWEHKAVADRMTKGLLEVVGSPGEKPEKMTAAQLVDTINETYDRDYLRAMTEDERKTVSKAAQARLDQLFEQNGGE